MVVSYKIIGLRRAYGSLEENPAGIQGLFNSHFKKKNLPTLF